MCFLWFLLHVSPDAGGMWSTDGCTVVTSLLDSTACFCNHTTNFAVLLQVYEMQVSEEPFSGLWGGCQNSERSVVNLWGVCVFSCFMVGAEEHQGGAHTADLDFYWMWSFLLCLDCYLHFIHGSWVRKVQTLATFSIFFCSIFCFRTGNQTRWQCHQGAVLAGGGRGEGGSGVVGWGGLAVLGVSVEMLV